MHACMGCNIKMENPFYLLFLVAISSLFVKLCTCFNPKPLNASTNDWGFSPALATWYGDPTGAGSGGACGFANDVAYAPFYAMISAGNANIFEGGKGCGTCYQVKCWHAYCIGSPITVTITDECPGLCNAVPYHFDLSGTAFGKMAKAGYADKLRNLGQVNIVYKRVPCNYPGTKIAFLVDAHSNPNYFAVAIEYENGDGDLSWVELGVGNNWLPMQQSWGAIWNVNITPQMKGPFSIKLTTTESKKTTMAYNVIPANWVPGKKYWSNINI